MGSISKISSVFIITLILTACGGQGSNSSDNSSANNKNAQHIATMANFLPLQIVNNTNLTGVPIYILIKALNSNNQQCIMQFNNGIGTCNVANAANLASYEMVTLSSLPQVNGNAVVYLPQVTSGRIYFSVGQPLDMYFDPIAHLVIDPDGFNPLDTNYYTLYDKVEFSYNSYGVWTNPTAVDNFSLPISLKQDTSISGVTSAGLSVSRNSIFNDVQNVFTQYDQTGVDEWKKLILQYTNRSNNSTILRLIAPGKAMATGLSGTNPFNPHYLANYVSALWHFYQIPGHNISVDCSELKGVLPMSSYIFTGSVDGNNTFIFKNADNSVIVPIKAPSNSEPYFAGAGDSFNAPNNTVAAILVRDLTSAFEVGLLPQAANGITLSATYFANQNSNFYTGNSINTLLGVPGGPWYDLYSKALHSYGPDQPIYTFAYDDALGQSGTLYDSNAQSPGAVTITLHDMSGTTIPDPYLDTNKYDITVNIPSTSTVIYNNAVLTNNQSIHGVTSPLNITLNGQEARIYINPTIIQPSSPALSGIVVVQNSNNHSAYTINFPAPGANPAPIVPLPPIVPIPTPGPAPTVSVAPTMSPTISPSPTVSTVPTPSVTPSPTPVPSTAPAPTPNMNSYLVTPLIGTNSVLTTLNATPLAHNIPFSITSPFTVIINGQPATIDIAGNKVTGSGALGVVILGTTGPNNAVSIAFPANNISPAPTPTLAPNPIPTPSPSPTVIQVPSPSPSPVIAGAYTITPLIGVGSTIIINGTTLKNGVEYSATSPITVTVNGQPANINISNGTVSFSGPGSIGIVSNGFTSSNNVIIAFPANNSPTTNPTPVVSPLPSISPTPTMNPTLAPSPTPVVSPTPNANSYLVTPLIGTNSILTTLSGTPLANNIPFSTISPFTVVINGQMATIDIAGNKITGSGALGIVIFGVTGPNNTVSVAFPANNVSPAPTINPAPIPPPTPVPTVNVTPTISPVPTSVPSPTPTANAGPVPSPSPVIGPTPTLVPSPTPTINPEPTPAAISFTAALHYKSECNANGCPSSGAYLVNNGADLAALNASLQAQNQSTNQWSNNRYAILLASGNYAMPNTFELGYYTQIVGLGNSNSEVVISPGVEVHNQCGNVVGDPGFNPSNPSNPACKTIGGLNNFWRSVENFTMNTATLPGSNGGVLIFAVSQAAPLRSIHVTGGNNLLLCDWHTNDYSCGFTSGGFMANSTIDGTFIPGSQQQWLSRNSNINKAQTAVWNSVFVGNNFTTPPTPPSPIGFAYQEPANNAWSNFPLSIQNSTPTIKEKPYLVCANCNNSANSGNYQWKVVVPALRSSASGIDTTAPSRSISVDDNFYVISQQTGTTSTSGVTTLGTASIAAINAALANKQNLIVMPGVYNLDGGTINVTNNNTIILGLGLPSLVCTSGNACMNISAEQGVELAGVVFDAGYKPTLNLLQIGETKNNANHSSNPVALYDIFFRIAETELSHRITGQDRQVTTALTIYTNDVIGDNIWIWRGDHDKASFIDPSNLANPANEIAANNLVTAEQNKAQYGLVVYGDNVIMYGLAVEHFQNYQTYWYGNNGQVYFYQAEMPYVVPSLSNWVCSAPNTPNVLGMNGCAAYVVDPSVTTHSVLGIGVYSYFANASIKAPSAIIAPHTSEITFTHIIGKWLNGNNGSAIANLITNSNTSDRLCWGLPVSNSTLAAQVSVLGGFNSSITTSENCMLSSP